MSVDRLKSIGNHLTGNSGPPHPFDPLSNAEIETAVQIVRKDYGQLFYNAVTLQEPRKQAMMKWVEDPEHSPRPGRLAEVVAIAKGGKVYDGIVDLNEGKVIKWESLEGVQPLVSFLVSALLASETNLARLRWRIFKS